MPVYRIPRSGEIFYQASAFAPRTAWSPRSDPAETFLLRARRRQRGPGATKKQARQAHPTPQAPPRTIGRKQEATGGHPGARAPEPQPFRPERGALSTPPQGGSSMPAFAAPLPIKAIKGGSVRAIAFYTTNDPEKTPAWKRYAQVLVKAGKGHAYGVQNQSEAIKHLNALDDTNIKQVFFVGHGFDASKTKFPAFMFSGHVTRSVSDDGREEIGFHANGDYNLLLCYQSEAFLRALVPHLSREGMVNVYLLSCHSGTDNRLQIELGRMILKLAPELDITVSGYKEYYMVALSPNISPRAHLRLNKDSAPLAEDSIAPVLPDGAIKYDDPLRSVALDLSDDPISGLDL